MAWLLSHALRMRISDVIAPPPTRPAKLVFGLGTGSDSDLRLHETEYAHVGLDLGRVALDARLAARGLAGAVCVTGGDDEFVVGPWPISTSLNSTQLGDPDKPSILEFSVITFAMAMQCF